MKNSKMLSRAELKKVKGGRSDTGCATTCNCPIGMVIKSGANFTIGIIPCKTDCIALNKFSVTCGTEMLRCDDLGVINTFCEALPIT